MPKEKTIWLYAQKRKAELRLQLYELRDKEDQEELKRELMGSVTETEMTRFNAV
jgi:hypothetical protein